MVAAPEPRLLTVQPFDKSLTQAVERAIRDSDLGLNPATQGNLIRVPLPALSEERRKELVKVVHKLAEEGRIAVRHARTETMVVILAGVAMNALFAWLLFTFLAVKNGRQIDPVTTVGRVVDELLPPEAADFKRIQPGTRVVSVNGKPVATWDDITQGIATTPDSEVRLQLADGSVVTAEIHPDALEQRAKAAQALQPYRAAVVGQVLPGRPAARAGVEPGDTIVAVNGRPVTQWYDLLELLQKNGQRPIQVEVARAGGRRQFEITPYVDSIIGPNGRPQAIGRIGVAVAGDFRSEPLSLGEAVVEGWHGTVAASTQIVRTVRGLFSGRISKREVGGPILIGQLAGESARMGLDPFLGFMSSRLFQRVREELGLAYAVFAYKHSYQSAGQLGVYIGTQPASADSAVDAIAAEYARLAKDGLPADELADGKQQLKGQVMLSLESPGARMGRLAGFVLHEDEYRPLDQMLAEIDAVTADEIAEVAAEYFAPERQTILSLGPAAGSA